MHGWQAAKLVQPSSAFKTLKTTMSRLDSIQNWPELAHQSGWCAAALAKQCKVSIRTLERYFRGKMSQPPKIWLVEQRQRQAVELLNQRLSIKETAIQLGYKHATHFSREFKKHWGFCPTQFNPDLTETQKRRVSV